VAATGQQAGGHRRSELDEPAAPYQQAEYSSGRMGSAWDDDPAGGYSWRSDDGAWPGYGQDGRRIGNAIRGLPPIPDEPLPVYPPGPFAAWNKGTSDRSQPAGSGGPGYRDRSFDTSPRGLSVATITPDEFDTNHSLPAIKDPILTKARTSGGTADRTATRGSSGDARTDTGRRVATARGRSAPARSAPTRSAPPRGTRGASRPGRKSRRQPVGLAIAAAVVIIAAVTAILVITSLGKPASNPNAGSTHRPEKSTSPTPTPSPGKWGHIGTRATDPIPLGLRELFPSRFVSAGVFFHATAIQQGHNCGNALISGTLQTAVRQAGCSQVLRASYIARKDNAMATIGVFNLKTSTAASNAAQHVGQSAFVAPLPSKNGLTSKLGRGTGIEEALVKGHYLILVWAERVDLISPKTNWQRQHLTDFMNTLIQNSVDVGLSYRMVNGAPQAAQPH